MALKLLLVDAALGRDGRARLIRDARAVAALDHPHAVHVYDVGEHKGVPFIAGGVFFFGVLQLANATLLLAQTPRYATRWWLAGGLACAALNFMQVPALGGVGAAIAQCACFGLVCLGTLHLSHTVSGTRVAARHLS